MTSLTIKLAPESVKAVEKLISENCKLKKEKVADKIFIITQNERIESLEKLSKEAHSVIATTKHLKRLGYPLFFFSAVELWIRNFKTLVK